MNNVSLVFDKHNPNWCPENRFNSIFFRAISQYLNQKLVRDGFLFLNDVYVALGFPRTQQGQVVGWKQGDYDGDACVVFTVSENTISNYTNIDITHMGNVLSALPREKNIMSNTETTSRVVRVRSTVEYALCSDNSITEWARQVLGYHVNNSDILAYHVPNQVGDNGHVFTFDMYMPYASSPMERRLMAYEFMKMATNDNDMIISYCDEVVEDAKEYRLEFSANYYTKSKEQAEYIDKLLHDLSSLLECLTSEATSTITTVDKGKSR